MSKAQYPRGRDALATLKQMEMSGGRKLLELYKQYKPDSEAAHFWHSVALGMFCEIREAMGKSKIEEMKNGTD